MIKTVLGTPASGMSYSPSVLLERVDCGEFGDCGGHGGCSDCPYTPVASHAVLYKCLSCHAVYLARSFSLRPFYTCPLCESSAVSP